MQMLHIPSLLILEKKFLQNFSQVIMNLKRYRKGAEMKEHRKTTRHQQKLHRTCRVVFLRSFIFASFLHFFQDHPYSKVCRNIFLSYFLFFVGGFLNHIPIEDERELETQHFWRRGQTPFAVMTNALKTRVQTSATNTACYQRLSNKSYLEIIATRRYILASENWR